MAAFASEQRESLLEGLKSLGLDEKWLIAVGALCAQEIAVRKRLEGLGESPSDEDFQVVAGRLAERLRSQGETPPEILLSIVRAYTHLRAKLVHHGHSVEIGQEEVNSLVTNTGDLVTSLFAGASLQTFDVQLAEKLITMERAAALVRIGKLDTKQKCEAILALLAKYAQLDALPSRDMQAVQLQANCRSLIDSSLTGLEGTDAAEVLDVALRNFSLVVPARIMEMISVLRSHQAVREMLKEKGYLSWVVTTFANSWSFDSASANADVILGLAPLLSKAQIETILNALASNDQIRYSWGAQKKMPPFIDWAEGKADQQVIANARENFPEE